jgi:hypothetical protein
VSEVEEKLRRGLTLIERSGGDRDLLGVALLALHGALEAHFRAALSERQDLTADERRLVDEQAVSGAPLIAMVRRYLGLGREQLALIDEANGYRRSLARGEPFDAPPGAVLNYARFVEAQCGMRGALDEALIERRHLRAQQAADEPPAADKVPADEPHRGISVWRLLVFAVLIVALLGAARVIYGMVGDVHLVDLLGLAGEPTVTPSPTAAALTPSPQPRLARVVRLGGGPGWLRETASFTSATLPPRISEGQEVVLLDQQAADTDGNRWQLVSFDGYEGWCPVNNIEILP